MIAKEISPWNFLLIWLEMMITPMIHHKITLKMTRKFLQIKSPQLLVHPNPVRNKISQSTIDRGQTVTNIQEKFQIQVSPKKL